MQSLSAYRDIGSEQGCASEDSISLFFKKRGAILLLSEQTGERVNLLRLFLLFGE